MNPLERCGLVTSVNFRMIKLKSNGLKALLISQSKLYGKVEKEEKVKTKKKRVSSELMAAVAMNVDVGSFYDFTTGVPGMAHFCEHMMFLGSEKYPEENGLDKYLKVFTTKVQKISFKLKNLSGARWSV